MLLHTLHACDVAHQQIESKLLDTDVEVLVCFFQEYISVDIVLLSSTRSRACVISVTRVCK